MEFFRACAILHKLMIEERDRDVHMGTKNFISVEPYALIVTIRSIVVPNVPYSAAAF